jgi:hypothetical protein
VGVPAVRLPGSLGLAHGGEQRHDPPGPPAARARRGRARHDRLRLVDALRHRPDAFTAAGKLTKPIWCGILGVAAIIAFIVVFNPLSIFGIITVVAAGVYLVDVRPALRNITGGSQGPYGRW